MSADDDEGALLDLSLRCIPRHVWVRFVLTRARYTDPGHGWLYHGIVRRDAWRIGPLALVLLRMRDADQPL